MDLTGAVGGGIALVVVAVDKVLAWRRAAASPPASLQARPGSMPDAPSLDFVVQQLGAKVLELAAAVEEMKRERSAAAQRAETRRIVTEVARNLRDELRKQKGVGDGGERSSEG